MITTTSVEVSSKRQLARFHALLGKDVPNARSPIAFELHQNLVERPYTYVFAQAQFLALCTERMVQSSSLVGWKRCQKAQGSALV